MVENGDDSGREELIFFDTFSHELNEKLNLDLVQFPNPVYISEIRIVPLGARVQADFPGGGNRLGATNPSQFDIEFFVNDLSVSVASTFEPLGKFSYNQNECINLECRVGGGGGGGSDSRRRIPTDGLVLKGYYTTITLAVYGNIITLGNMQKIPSSSNVDEHAAHISSNDEANESDNGESYRQSSNAFQDQNSSCDPIADDMKFDDHQGTPPVNVYSRSPSKEQELTSGQNVKTKRDWSHSDSPEESYQQQQYSKRSKVYRKQRSPPLQSPRISRPDDEGDELMKKSHAKNIDTEYADQSMHGDLSSTYCPSSPNIIINNNSSNTPIESPTDHVMEDELEPILSDDDIISDEVNGVEEEEEQLSDEMFAEFSTKMFNPFQDNLRKVEPRDADDTGKFDKFRELLSKLSDEFEKKKFHEQDTPAAVNEGWPTMCEQLIHCIHAAHDGAVADNFVDAVDLKVKSTVLSCIKIGLNYTLSTKYHQAGCNVRHLKAGLRLVECLSNNDTFLNWTIEGQRFDLYQNLFDLFPRQLIPMPVKLLIARVVYKLIDTNEGFRQFAAFDGYRKAIDMMSSFIDIRLLYTLKSILKKVHVYETLEQIKSTTIELYRNCKMGIENRAADQIVQLENLFSTLGDAHQKDILQSRKFVPIASQFEILSKIRSPDFVAYYKVHSLAEILALLLNMKHVISPRLLLLVFRYLKLMLNNGKELNYLSSNIDLLNDIVKTLLEQPQAAGDVDASKTEAGSEENFNIDIGLEISYKVEARYLVDSISSLSDDMEITQQLNMLYYLCVGAGKRHVLNLISMDDNLCVFLNLIDREKKLSMMQGSSGGGVFKHKSPVLSYSVDVIDFVVRNVEHLDYLKKFESILVNLVKHHETFEPSVAAILQELAVFLKPLEAGKLFDYADITPLVENIKRSMEFLTNFPGDLIMTLRILRNLIVGDNDDDDTVNGPDYRELKRDYFAMLLFHADGVPALLAVLDKICTHFDQPMIHSYLFGANQGVLMMQIVRPTVQIVRKLMVQAIEARTINYKDTTAIDTLLRTYTLMCSINPRCMSYNEAKAVQSEIVKILLMFTQSIAPDGMNTANITRSLWTQMIGEVIKYALNGPYRFISGLMILSELLPLPLPIPVQTSLLSKLEAQRLVAERQLWSAHLHPQSQFIVEMIQTFCISSNADLISLLYRVCIQLSDLAPNMTLNVARAIVDVLSAEAADKNNEGSNTLSRLLKFLALLVRHPCVKVSVLSILNGKLAEILSQLLRIVNDSNADHVLSQFYAFVLLQNLFDCEISLLYNTHHHSPELILASGLPFKELIAQFAEDVVENFVKTSAENLHFAALRTMVLLTEHDVTMKILKNILLKKEVVERFNAIAEKCKNDRKRMLIIPDILGFFRSLLTIDDGSDATVVPPRTTTLSADELSNILRWNSEEYRNGNRIHFLQVFAALVSESRADDEEETTSGEVHGVNLKSDVDSLLERLREAGSGSNHHQESVASSADETPLPQAEGIVTQFSSRSVFLVTDNFEDLTMDYWMLNGCVVDDEEIPLSTDQVKCDLEELVRECIPDVNVLSDCKRLLALSSSPPNNRDKTQTGLCFRTRRVEVTEAPSGRPEKKIFSKYPTRGRGFSRVAIRGDIFRSRPPNTSRPPSLHVDDFVAMESGGGGGGGSGGGSGGGQSTYSKIVQSVPRGGRSRGSSFIRGRGATSFSTNLRGHASYTRGFRDSGHFRGRPIRSRGRGYPR